MLEAAQSFIKNTNGNRTRTQTQKNPKATEFRTQIAVIPKNTKELITPVNPASNRIFYRGTTPTFPPVFSSHAFVCVLAAKWGLTLLGLEQLSSNYNRWPKPKIEVSDLSHTVGGNTHRT
jgi:hypothetical protein